MTSFCVRSQSQVYTCNYSELERTRNFRSPDQKIPLQKMKHSPASPIPADLQLYLNEIAERLYTGHAAIMVGSGFSRNVQLHSHSNNGFPDWTQLGNLFYEKLHGEINGSGSEFLSVPTLAHEVEAAVGRPALNQMLRDVIPDGEHEPSRLHKDLLQLPWSDVFTTNFDTLLERACNSVISRKYDIVVNHEELFYAKRPRIVKLHGSFPSVRPFVITDEDYRCFPVDNAPFVNVVRQSLLENTLCLVGFSGNDPNFLQWLGWIHDNFGRQDSPKIYLVGLLSLTDSQTKLLERRNIVPIDMSKCPGKNNDNHFSALDKFFRYLRSWRARHSPLDWPLDDPPYFMLPEDDAITMIRELVPAWREVRRSYPGWIIVPEDRRRDLRRNTVQWTGRIRDTNDLPSPLDLEFAYELTWRMERCLIPMDAGQVDFFEATLERYIPHGDKEESPETPLNLIEELEKSDLTRSDVREMCHHLLLALLRFYREKGLLEKWDETCDRLLDCMHSLSPEHVAHFHYENVLSAMFELNLQNIRIELEKWPFDDSLPFWEAKRAGLLAEIGQVGESERILKKSLTALRSRLNLTSITNDYTMVSQESFIMLLLRAVKQPPMGGNFNAILGVPQGSTQRWHTLRQYKCDPGQELDAFERTLDWPTSDGLYVNVRERPSFEIGQRTHTHHIGSLEPEDEIAHGFLRFCEEVGLPFNLQGWLIAEDSARGAISRVSVYSTYWATATLVRMGFDGHEESKQTIDILFGRASIARMDTNSVDKLVKRFLRAFQIAVTDTEIGIPKGEQAFGARLADIAPEVLSRLCSKCSASYRGKLTDFLLAYYCSDPSIIPLGFMNLTKRLLNCLSTSESIRIFPRLLNLPILHSLDHKFQEQQFNPINFLRLEREWMPANPDLSDTKLGRLLEKVDSDDTGTKEWASTILFRLDELGLLETIHRNQFAEALWSKVGEDGFPVGTTFKKSKFLAMPHPQQPDPISLFRDYVRRSTFSTRTRRAFLDSHNRESLLCEEIQDASQHLDWTENDVQAILKGLVNWWNESKPFLTSHDFEDQFGTISDRFAYSLPSFLDTIVSVVTPEFNPIITSPIRGTLQLIIEELSELGLPTLRLEMASIRLFPERRKETIQRIANGMASSAQDTVSDSILAFVSFITSISSVAETDHKEDFIQLLRGATQVLYWRREPGLSEAINAITTVVNENPWALSEELETTIQSGLCRLISDTANFGEDVRPFYQVEGSLDVSRKLVLRRNSANLAYALTEKCLGENKAVPKVLKVWDRICKSDEEFADIKNLWIRSTSA